MNTLANLSQVRRAGMTLVELLVASAILSVFLMMAMIMARSSSEFYSTASINGARELAVESSLNEMVNELMETRASTITQPVSLLTPPSSSKTLTFRRVLSFDAAKGIYESGPLTRISLEGTTIFITTDADSPTPQQRFLIDGVAEMAAGELPNGVDDNGNGLVDEGGLAFVLETSFTVRIYLSLERRNAEGVTDVVSGSSLVQVRNR
jgi:prepilin-type N-terminal cleavage/methylation domain-containing protein